MLIFSDIILPASPELSEPKYEINKQTKEKAEAKQTKRYLHSKHLLTNKEQKL